VRWIVPPDQRMIVGGAPDTTTRHPAMLRPKACSYANADTLRVFG